MLTHTESNHFNKTMYVMNKSKEIFKTEAQSP